MRILVTGITGQIGSALVGRMQTAATILAADRNALDLTRPDQIGSRLDALAPDVIINPAAYTAVDRAEDEKELAFLVNGRSPGAIASWAADHRVPLVHFSTDYVFDGSGEKPWREDDRVSPLNAYGASKLAGERAIQSAGGASLIVRTSWIYAATGVNFLLTMTRLMRERDELRIVADQFGAPTSAALVADAVANIVERNLEDLPSAFARSAGKINLTAEGVTTWHGFAKAILVGLKKRNMQLATRSVLPIASGDYPTKAKRPLNSRLDLSRLAEIFKIRPEPWDVCLDRELDALVSARIR